ncbi:hypothetical protein Scep_016753 [Stephania cephalantha]|uniref:Uncharacterized protein n=1 Tax=Stephania cephalantha TaxID=152367 RepID=A0AAP0NUZ3_9MAGN
MRVQTSRHIAHRAASFETSTPVRSEFLGSIQARVDVPGTKSGHSTVDLLEEELNYREKDDEMPCQLRSVENSC